MSQFIRTGAEIWYASRASRELRGHRDYQRGVLSILGQISASIGEETSEQLEIEPASLSCTHPAEDINQVLTDQWGKAKSRPS